MEIRQIGFERTIRRSPLAIAPPGARPTVMEPMEPRLLLAGLPVLAAGTMIQDGASPMEVELMSAPAVTDWDCDGLKDLLVGAFTQGYIWRFLNQGTDPSPTFNGGSRVQSGGVDITTSYG